MTTVTPEPIWKAPAITSWKSAATAVPDDEALENTFAAAAYPFVQQKARPLMKPAYIIGFEIVYKNSPDNNRLVGLFAFKIGDVLLYVPAFFINGQIKGVMFLYDYLSKLINPLNEGWCQHYLEKNLSATGRGVDRSQAQRFGTRVAMDSFGAGMFGKTASEDIMTKEHWMVALANKHYNYQEHGIKSADFHEAWQEYQSSPKMASVLRPILGEFLGEVFDTEQALTVLEKIANFSPVAEECLTRRSSALADFERVATEKIARAKQASTAEQPRIILHNGDWHPGIKVASATYAMRGFHIEEIGVKQAAEVKVLPFKEEDARAGITSVTSPGLYELAKLDGKKVKALLVWRWEDRSSCSPLSNRAHGASARVSNLIAFVPSEKLVMNVAPSDLFGEKIAEVDSDQFRALTDASPTISAESDEGSICGLACTPCCGNLAVIETSGECLRVYGSSVKDKDGIKVVDNSLFVNPDLDRSAFDKRIIGNKARFLTTKRDWAEAEAAALGFVTSDTIRQYLTGDGWKKLTVSADPEDGETMKFRVSGDSRVSPAYKDPAKFAGMLVQAFGMSAASVHEIFDGAVNNGQCSFLLRPTAKSASALRVVDTPVFQESYDPMSGASLDYPQSRELRTEFTPHNKPPMLPGDRWDPAKYVQQVMEESPEKLYTFARDNNVANVFDHGVVGALVRSKDFGQQIDGYVKDLAAATDKVGRMLFLLFWSPEDYEKSYGTDDITEKEIELKTVFESLGDVTLGLMKRVRERETGDQTMLASTAS